MEREPQQRIRFCTTPDGVRLAFALIGHGPPLLYVNGWPEHLEMEWRQPFARRFLLELAAGATLIRYDMRGSGLSDRVDTEDVRLDLLEDDLLTIANQVPVARLPVVSMGMLGAPLALQLAAHHPERVRSIAIVSGFVRGADIMEPGNRRSLSDYVRQFGFPHFDYVDSAGVGIDEARGVRSLQRAGAAPSIQAAVLDEMFSVDLVPVLDDVRCPVLVVHAEDDPFVPFELGRDLAARLPEAEFHPVRGDTAAPWALADAILPAIRNFLGVAPGLPAGAVDVPLTPREDDVLALVVRGRTNREIAAELCIAEKTVKTHVSNILAKLGVRDRTQAAVEAVHRGISRS